MAFDPRPVVRGRRGRHPRGDRRQEVVAAGGLDCGLDHGGPLVVAATQLIDAEPEHRALKDECRYVQGPDVLGAADVEPPAGEVFGRDEHVEVVIGAGQEAGQPPLDLGQLGSGGLHPADPFGRQVVAAAEPDDLQYQVGHGLGGRDGRDVAAGGKGDAGRERVAGDHERGHRVDEGIEPGVAQPGPLDGVLDPRLQVGDPGRGLVGHAGPELVEQSGRHGRRVAGRDVGHRQLRLAGIRRRGGRIGRGHGVWGPC
jgi:hypothetical protein